MKKLLSTAIALFALILWPVNASAHAGVVSTNPEQGQVLTSMPSELSITFSEDLLTIEGKDVNTLSLTHFDGPPVELGAISVNGATITAQVPESEYDSGQYELVYSIVSADGHKLTDSLTFSLNTPTLYAEPVANKASNGVIPAPIVGAIVAVVLLGGFYLIRRRR